MPFKYTCDHVCFTKGLKVRATYGFKTQSPNRCFECRAFGVMVRNPLEYCKHRIKKKRCKECDGSAYCEHGKRKSRCKECGGSQICEHDRERSKCKECLHTKRLQDKDQIIFDEFN